MLHMIPLVDDVIIQGVFGRIWIGSMGLHDVPTSLVVRFSALRALSRTKWSYNGWCGARMDDCGCLYFLGDLNLLEF
jgi:hypothetical protein